MKKDLIISFIIGVFIILIPTIITGHTYNTSTAIGGLLYSEFIMRNISFIIGLLVIYDGLKNYFNK
ncbi:hypothetical protein [Caloranaerobacter sp. DY30410]|uniref:hypothetical protein n=1 Tax=Caloranaerobacter sp. DY30410 TaxID=3238305 RepID=UPI003D0092DE